MSRNVALASLIALSAILLSLPFLVPGTGFLSLVAFVPLLFAEEIAHVSKMKGFCLWHYSCFVLWNAATTFWVCNATVGGGLFAIFANAFQMSLVFGIFRWSRKHAEASLPYLLLALGWIAWERFYLTSAQISWPWLVLGNSFARTTDWIQWYEYVGTLGGSLWIWACNLSIFGILKAICNGDWKSLNLKARYASVIGTVVLLIAPPAISAFIQPGEPDETMNVCLAQPNIDPYDKFVGMTQEQQNILLLQQFEASSHGGETLLIAPETFTSDIVTNDLSLSPTVNAFQKYVDSHPGTAMLFGASTRDYIQAQGRPSQTARKVRDGLWVENHNSSIMLNHQEAPQIFHKSKLVVAVEQTPYPAIFRPLDDLLGGVMGRCVGQDEVTCLDAKLKDGDNARDVALGSAICYESVYGEYCLDYVRKGARLLTVITNDAWWKDTPGYRQHLSYSSLRAIETRRWIARCANTGISAIIDPSGKIVSKTSWWKPEMLEGEVGLSDVQTFFVRHGDFVGRLSVLMFFLLLASTAVKSVIKPKDQKKRG